ncbi:Wzz/FepE/Etk N-terminal domain-containing protein (plasmid) [Legionella sp. D16C41]|uniref:Wzz/FepE/Etk N-terminal domain-containing protein n=1 Tax=Legionella sp. D16C41 TaxID=3402688 RepID=UPI003AF7EF54
MTDNGDEKRLLEKKKFNEERIQAWKAQRLAAAELAAKERREKAESERATRAEQFRRQRQEEIDTVEKEKKVAALDKLPSLEQIYRTKQAIVFEHHRKKRLFLKQITLLILISAILTCIISFFATPFYEAEAIVTIKTNSLNDNTLGSAILPTSVSPSIMQNIFSAREYIFSREMMNRMEKEQGFISYFKNPDTRFLSRPFSTTLINTDDYNYYKRRVKVAIDIQEGILKIKVQAKSQQDAKRFADALLLYAENWVNTLSSKMFADKIKEAQDNVIKREKNLQIARKRIVNLQISKRDLNPRETVAAIYASLSDIKAKIKQAEQEIGVYKKAEVKNSPVVERLSDHLVVLREQQRSLNKRLVDNGAHSMNKVLSGFESALIERDFAEKEWEVALKSLEDIKLQVFNQRQYFLTIVPPITSPIPVEPQKLKLFLLILIILYSLVTLVSLIKTAIKISIKT